MKMNHLLPVLLLIGITSSLTSCLYDELDEPAPPPLTFQEWCDSLQPTLTRYKFFQGQLKNAIPTLQVKILLSDLKKS